MRSFSTIGHALVFERHGVPENVLAFREVVVPDANALGPHEILVGMLAAPINPSDVNTVEGRYPLLPALPAVGGHEGVGKVLAVGSEVSRMGVGDHVVPLASKQGTWRSHAVFEERSWARVPQQLPLSILSCLTINPPTALCLLRDFVALRPGDVVIQNGASSAVGQYVIQLAHHWGLRTVNIVRDREPEARAALEASLRAQGATEVVTLLQLRALFATGALPAPKLGLDCVGGEAAGAVIKALAPGGTMVTYGAMSKQPLTAPASSLIFKDVSLRGFWLSGAYSQRPPEEKEALVTCVADLFKDKVLQPTPVQCVPLSEFHTALKKVQAGGAKVVLSCDADDAF